MVPNQKESKPSNQKSQKVLICFGLTSDMEFAAGVSILNFVGLHGSEDFDFVVYSDSGMPRMVSALGLKGIDVEVIVYHPPIKWHELYSSRAIAYFSPQVLSKFEIFNNLEHYSRVIWFDYDIVIKHPLTELLSATDFDFACLKSNQSIGDAFIKAPKGIDLAILAKDGISAGLLMVRDSFPDHQKARQKLYDLYLRHSSNLYYPEQAIFDIFLEKEDYRWLRLDGEIYCDNPEHEIAQSLILHAWGPKKFWNGRSNLSWSSYFKEWRSIGGSRYSPLLVLANGISRRVQHALALVILRIVQKRNP
jgi:hypothetical protein